MTNVIKPGIRGNPGYSYLQPRWSCHYDIRVLLIEGLSVKPGLRHMGNWQTVRTQIRRSWMQHLIRVCTACLNYRKSRVKGNSQPFSCWTLTCPVLANDVEPDQLASEEANWSGSALFVTNYVNFYQKPGSSNLIGWNFEESKAS